MVNGALELRDGRLLSWSRDWTLRLWAADGTELAVLRGHEDEVRGALELRDGRLLSWSEDTTLRLWAADGTPLGAIRIDASPSEVRAWFAAHTPTGQDVHRARLATTRSRLSAVVGVAAWRGAASVPRRDGRGAGSLLRG
jgi:WD40 repeat protein